jgi:hypothetical protein
MIEDPMIGASIAEGDRATNPFVTFQGKRIPI